MEASLAAVHIPVLVASVAEVDNGNRVLDQLIIIFRFDWELINIEYFIPDSFLKQYFLLFRETGVIMCVEEEELVAAFERDIKQDWNFLGGETFEGKFYSARFFKWGACKSS